MASQKQFNVGIVGYGLSAKVFHIPFIALTPTLKLHSILQRTPTPSSSAPADHPTAIHHTSFDALLADPDLDIHVLVEKPFVPTSAEADALASLAREKGLVLCVYQNRRWDSDFLTVQRLIGDGTLGRVVEFETHFDRLRIQAPSGSWKASMGMKEGGGVLFDLGTHLIDQAFVLFGMPRLDPQEDQLRVGGKATDAGFGREDEAKYGRLSLLADDGTVADQVCPTVEPVTYLKFYELFAKAVESGKEEDVPVPATQAAQVLRILEAARESAQTGREVAP
ncbi:hypothetical protein N0V88_002160 [Collariella sp. IMI 366227]|nr:hypothetical protein N0V88_002160 [Collariella sp. IMI 366227]